MSDNGRELPPAEARRRGLRPPGATNATYHLRPFGGTARRLAPTLELEPGGRWRGRVRVVPIEGLESRLFDNGRGFAVVVEWVGPPLPIGGERVAGVADALDEIIVGDHELARLVAHAAAELLREPTLPFLRELRQSIEQAGEAWRRHYEHEIGDDARAAAEGY